VAKKPKGKPKLGAIPQPTKTPRVQQPPPGFRGGVLAWRFNAVDKGGPFAWSDLSDPVEFKALIEKLADFETMNEAALGGNGCHFIDVTDLSKEAQDRLIAIELDDLDQLYSMRIKGKMRVHCVHRPQYMRVLWYDPQHKVCPSPKKHT
jgi:hypothetical protein